MSTLISRPRFIRLFFSDGRKRTPLPVASKPYSPPPYVKGRTKTFKENPMLDAAVKTEAEVNAAIEAAGTTPCKHAAIYHDYISSLQRMANEQTSLVRTYRCEYDYFYDHLNHLPRQVREDAEPEICAIVERIEQGSCALSVAREGLSKAFDDACISKMVDIAAGQIPTTAPTAKRYLKAMEIFREWRVSSMDARNVDMAPLLDERKDFRPGKAGLFEKVFSAWAKETNPNLSVGNTRSIVLDGLAQISPEMAPRYVASLNAPEIIQFTSRYRGTEVPSEADLAPFA